MTHPLSIVFAGTPVFGLPCLEALSESLHTIKAVYTQPDRPSGRGQKLQTSPIKAWANQQNIPVYQPVNFKSDEVVKQLEALAPDVLVVIAYGLILPARVLTIPRLGCINVHASLLPRWRGASPIVQPILHNEKESGVTIMQMDVGLDTGDMLACVRCELTPDETAETLHDKLAQLSIEPLLITLNQLSQGTAHPVKQDEQGATYAAKIAKVSAAINWQQPSERILCAIRAFNPWPIAYTTCGDSHCRIYEAELVSNSTQGLPGEVLHIDKKGIEVATQDGVIRLKTIQFPGGKAMSVATWLNGAKLLLAVGDRLRG